MKLLLCRTAWAETYTSLDEKATGGHKYLKEYDAPALETLNYKINCTDNQFYAYVPHDTKGGLAKININRLGADKSDEYIDGITVIFVAPHPYQKDLRITGVFFDARVYREWVQRPDNDDLVARVVAKQICAIPEEDRVFRIPRARDAEHESTSGFGQSAFWYGLSDLSLPDKLVDLRNSVIKYVQVLGDGIETTPWTDSPVFETRKNNLSERLERSSAARKFIDELGFKCEACEWEITPEERPIWGSSFEVHHKEPMAALEPNASREIKRKDLAVLCASCHRAIHRYGVLDNIEEFKRNCL